MEKLEATGAFHDVLPTQEDTTDEGLHRLMVRSTYTGTVSEAPEAARPRRPSRSRRNRSPQSRKRSLPPALRLLRPRRLSRVRRLARRPRPRHQAVAQDAEAQDDDRRPAYRLGASSRRLPDRRGAARQHRAVCVGVFPLARRVQTGEQQAGDATRELVAAQKVYASARGTVTGKKEADVELLKFYEDVLPADLSEARRVLYPRLDPARQHREAHDGALELRAARRGQDGRSAAAGDDADRLGRTTATSGVSYISSRRRRSSWCSRA